jgi:isopentenyl diphosphate isomerase/L-lactate dehydrogenase-like FMN-dependent dehydrogenase
MAGFQPDPGADRNLVTVADFERAAAAVLPPGPLAYYAGGAMDERTLADNLEGFRRHRLVPRMMRDVAAVDLSTTILGRRWPLPLWVAPTALQRMAHPEGEVATARAAAARGVTFGLSSSASTDMQDIAAVGGPRWYQVYLLEDAGARRAMVERAVECGFEALVLTVDLQRLGRRERDIRVGFAIPDGVVLPNIARAAGVDPRDAPRVPFIASLKWEHLEWLAGFGLPVLLKGVLHPEDARLAVEHGAAGVVVSNHGGRQLDGRSPASTRCRRWRGRSTVGCRCCSTAGCGAGPTCWWRWRWGPRRWASGGRRCGGWPSRASTGSARCSTCWRRSSSWRWRSAGRRTCGRSSRGCWRSRAEPPRRASGCRQRWGGGRSQWARVERGITSSRAALRIEPASRTTSCRRARCISA